jgi:hypothetical protein
LDLVESLVREALKISSSRKVLSNESVEIFYPSLLPRAIRISEVGSNTVLINEFAMENILSPIVIGNRSNRSG